MRLTHLALLLLLPACVGGAPDRPGDPGPGPGAVEPGVLKGRVLDHNGRPMRGVEVVADNTLLYDTNALGHTDADGRYRIDVSRPAGTWQASATARLPYNGGTVEQALAPDDDTAFAGNAGAIRNFALRFMEQTPDDPYGHGGMLVVRTAIGDYTPAEEIEVTLEPVGPLWDGSTGQPVARKLRSTGEGYVVTGLPYGRYRVSARHKGTALRVSPALTPGTEYQWADSHTGVFERHGPRIYQLRVDVKQPG